MSSIDTSYTTSAVSAVSNTASTTESESGTTTQAASSATETVEISSQYSPAAQALNNDISRSQLAEEQLERGSAAVEHMREMVAAAKEHAISADQRAAIQADLFQAQETFRKAALGTDLNTNPPIVPTNAFTIQTIPQGGMGQPGTNGTPGEQINALGIFSLDVTTEAGISEAAPALNQATALLSDAREQVSAVRSDLEARIETVSPANRPLKLDGEIKTPEAAIATAELIKKQVTESPEIATQSHANASRTDALQLLGV